MTSAMIFQIQSGIILFLMYLGIYFRRARKIHVGLMSVVIIWDIILILQIELTRNAVAKATEAMKNPMLLNIHIANRCFNCGSLYSSNFFQDAKCSKVLCSAEVTIESWECSLQRLEL
jgi:hypothetical protein